MINQNVHHNTPKSRKGHNKNMRCNQSYSLNGTFTSMKHGAVICVDKLQQLSEYIRPQVFQFYLRNTTTITFFHYTFRQVVTTTCHNVLMSWESCCANLTNK